MARKDWSSPRSAQDYILKSLREYNKGATESMLNTRHDPTVISRVLELLVERGVIDLRIDNNKVGTNRRVYTLVEGTNQ